MNDDQHKFERNMSRFFELGQRDDKTLDIGGQREERMKQAISDALDDLDNLDEKSLEAYDRFGWTEAEMERVRNGKDPQMIKHEMAVASILADQDRKTKALVESIGATATNQIAEAAEMLAKHLRTAPAGTTIRELIEK